MKQNSSDWLNSPVRINNHETPVLMELAARVPTNGLIVEIGAAFGHSITRMAEAALASVHLITIDPWTLLEQKGQAERFEQFKKAVEPFGDRIEAIQAFSRDVDPQGFKQRIDLLFIDGDHSHAATLEDYFRYYKYIRRGGLLIFHDYRAKQKGVDLTVDGYVIPSGLWMWYTSHRFWIGVRL